MGLNGISILFIIVIGVGGLLLILNGGLAVSLPYIAKVTSFECGFSAFSQTRSQFTVAFYIVGILFLLFDIEIILMFPYALAAHINESYGLALVVIFILMLTLGFSYEFGKDALKISVNDNKSVLPMKSSLSPII